MITLPSTCVAVACTGSPAAPAAKCICQADSVFSAMSIFFSSHFVVQCKTYHIHARTHAPAQQADPPVRLYVCFVPKSRLIMRDSVRFPVIAALNLFTSIVKRVALRLMCALLVLKYYKSLNLSHFFFNRERY